MTATLPEIEVQPENGASSEELLELRDEVRRQGESMRATQRAFSIFALMALLLAGATLLAVAFKLDNTTKSTGVSINASPTVTPSASTPAAAPALPHSVGVSLREFAIDTTPGTAGAGKVTFTVRNTGAAKHEFVVLKTPNPARSLLKGAEADEAGNVGEIGNVSPGQSKKLTLNLKAGHYALICNLAGHYKAGQYKDFTVR